MNIIFETVPQLVVFCRCTEPLPIFTSFLIFIFFNQQQAKTNLFAQSRYNNNRMATFMKLGNVYGPITELDHKRFLVNLSYFKKQNCITCGNQTLLLGKTVHAVHGVNLEWEALLLFLPLGGSREEDLTVLQKFNVVAVLTKAQQGSVWSCTCEQEQDAVWP